MRFVFIPSSYFSRAVHRQSTVEREAAKPIHHAGATACQDCHYEIVETKGDGYHKTLACETCHGPSVAHTEEPFETKPFAPRDRKFCPVCHTYDAARPTGFPQINPAAHNPLEPCITCHNPHDPVPPETPRDCSACHAQIARTKAVSSHARLDCTTCHEAGEQHKIDPRSTRPSKPQTRDFCGRCHGTDSSEELAPKVDLSQHGQTYLCWQCHYPHLPEGRE
jgi:DnaJ-class molecular chaperone